MTRTRGLVVRMAIVLSSMFLLTGCLDALAEMFVIELFTTSDDPELQVIGEALLEASEERRANEAIEEYVRTGDRSHLQTALELRPRDPEVLAYYLATLGTTDPSGAQRFGATGHLFQATAAELQAEGVDVEDDTISVRIRVLERLERVQRRLLGGGADTNPRPPPRDQDQLPWQEYCHTIKQLNEFVGYDYNLTDCF